MCYFEKIVGGGVKCEDFIPNLLNSTIMNKISKFLSVALFVLITSTAIVMADKAGVTCTRVFALIVYDFHHEYWCCGDPEVCFWDTYIL
jgi:hypothetical protein